MGVNNKANSSVSGSSKTSSIRTAQFLKSARARQTVDDRYNASRDLCSSFLDDNSGTVLDSGCIHDFTGLKYEITVPFRSIRTSRVTDPSDLSEMSHLSLVTQLMSETV